MVLLSLLLFCSAVSVSLSSTSSSSSALFPTAAANVRLAPFNASGDGSIDDRSAIQSAIDFAAATGGTVFFPAGTYRLSAPVLLASGVRIKGVGRNTVLCVAQAVSGHQTHSAVS